MKGIGEKRACSFEKLGIYTIEDMIFYFPRDYEDRSNHKKIADLNNGEICSFSGVITSKVFEVRTQTGMTISKVNVEDETSKITLIWFNQKYIKNLFKLNEKYLFYGKVLSTGKDKKVQNPVYEKVEDSINNTLKIIPKYSLREGIKQTTIRTSIKNALEKVSGILKEDIPQEIRERYDLEGIDYSIKNIHFPESEEDFKKARKRLVFEELLFMQLALSRLKYFNEKNPKGIKFSLINTREFLDAIGFELTHAQKRVFGEIEKDMESEKVMNRLIQGDVGSGKTVVAMISMYKAVKSGFQAALMVPTEILARQHYEFIKNVMGKFNIKVELILGGQKKKTRERVLAGMITGAIDIVIGTHALIGGTTQFKNLGLVITDEQHRFGVKQRASLTSKGMYPDTLVMTATPIPRTLALILYGDLDISIIDELPPGRRKIETYWTDNKKRKRVNEFIRKKVQEGRQVYIVCPLVEENDENEENELKSVVNTALNLAKSEFVDLRIGLIHGKMKSEYKNEIMKSFSLGEIDILVSTTVIEVGINVPNATIMIIENAERFGLATLHQLRGRIGRGEHSSYCIMYNESESQIAKERLNIIKDCSDGFIIAEKDLYLRGPGEFFGTRQHGLPFFKIANLYTDLKILKMAQEASEYIFSKDSRILEKEKLRIRERLDTTYSNLFEEISLN